MTNMRYMLYALCILLTAATLTACSPDRESEETEEETILLPEPDEPEPHWADGVITITTGNYKTGEQLFNALDGIENYYIAPSVRAALMDPNFPMSRQKKTVNVIILTLREMGFTEPVSYPEIRNKCRELGYRPLTLEEVMELRRQFTDQPTYKTEHRTSVFSTILSKEHTHFRSDIDGIPMFFVLSRIKGRDFLGVGISIYPGDASKMISPFDIPGDELSGFNKEEHTRFACAIVD